MTRRILRGTPSRRECRRVQLICSETQENGRVISADHTCTGTTAQVRADNVGWRAGQSILSNSDLAVMQSN
jgi:hypothetical protein